MPQCFARPRSLTTGSYIQDHPLSQPQPDDIAFPQVAHLTAPTTVAHEYVHLSDIEAGQNSMRVLQQLVSEPPREALAASRPIWIIGVGGYLFSALCMMYTLGIYRIFYVQFGFKGSGGGFRQNNGLFYSDDVQWAKVMRRMIAIWRLARLGCAVLLPLSITLLQIDGVVNTVLARTCTISTAVFAAAGLLSSGIYLFMRKQLISGQNKARWIKASQAERSHQIRTIEFWTCLSLPVASMVWGILTCLVTVVCIAWTHSGDDDEEPRSAFISSAAFITSLIVITLFYVLRAASMAIWS